MSLTVRPSGVATPGLAHWLGLAAAPTFATLALLTGLSGGGEAALLCAPAQGGSALKGMALMYGLMAVFHLAPWLKQISRGEKT